MKLQDHIEVISKVAEIAGKEYSIEQVKIINPTISNYCPSFCMLQPTQAILCL